MIVMSFGGKTPKIAESALVADTAFIIGDVEIGENTSIWPGVVIRGDIEPVRIGSNCHIEDNRDSTKEEEWDTEEFEKAKCQKKQT